MNQVRFHSTKDRCSMCGALSFVQIANESKRSASKTVITNCTAKELLII